jgi:hypothetical protein
LNFLSATPGGYFTRHRTGDRAAVIFAAPGEITRMIEARC